MAKSFDTIGILHRSDRKEAREYSLKVAQWLAKKGKTVRSVLSPIPKVSEAKSLDELDLMVVLGGDGTYLQAVGLLDGRDVPVLGANFGHTGFLTEAKAEEILTVLEDVLKGKGRAQERSMLDVTIKGKGKKARTFRALNDVVVERGGDTHLIEMSVVQGGRLVTRFRADGLIIATPTGSTAYNLSAAGPIVHPGVPAIVVTPVCPHSLTARSITVPDSEDIQIKLNNPNRSAVIMVDGQSGGELGSDEEMVIKKSKCRHIMLSSQNYDYFERLNAKLQFGQRT
ncbi:MAG TPA: NAD(+)/NADH kinase [Bdellovibrionales bacterium]|nr:NAD(+)/NADH kinase [Bdellovibrionales bacterium]